METHELCQSFRLVYFCSVTLGEFEKKEEIYTKLCTKIIIMFVSVHFIIKEILSHLFKRIEQLLIDYCFLFTFRFVQLMSIVNTSFNNLKRGRILMVISFLHKNNSSIFIED